MTTNVFNSGDVVIHSAGGPRMTVEFFRAKPEQISPRMAVLPAGVLCVWFDKENKLQRARFDAAHLTKIDGVE